LDRQELARAHQLLSQWYGDPSLTPVEAEKVETLLGQLAGTVVYSTEHQLEPAYVVKSGDTLETIAKQYEVPWQLLAKINGIPAADQVRPGQELKVVRGPFTAVVDLGRSQLTLMLDGRYAGKFPVTVPSAAAVSEGQWLVDQKLVVPSASVAQSAYAPAPAAVVRAIMLRGDAAAGQAASASTLTMIASGGVVVNSLAGTPAIIRVSPQDAEELSDILSVGSRVVIRR
jgi:LysM repeat protein